MKRFFQVAKLNKPVVTMHNSYIRIQYGHKQTIIKSLAWLKDHSKNYLTSSGQKVFTSSQCRDATIKEYNIVFDKEWKLVIRWNPLKAHEDGIHQVKEESDTTSEYLLDWLLNSDKELDYLLPKYTLWNNLDIKSLFCTYDEFISTGIKSSIRTLYDSGLLIVKNCPNNKETVCKLATQLGPLYNSFYGSTWDVKNTSNAVNVAYTAQELGLHMDLMYFKNPPGIQLLHCIHNSKIGGENMFSDAYKAMIDVKDVKIDNKFVWDILKDVLVTFEYKSDNHWLNYNRPVLKTANGSIKEVNYSPPFQGVLFGNQKELSLWYKAMYEFERYLSKNMISYKLNPGETAIFLNNRIAHGRRTFNGDRHLRGAYVSHCDFLDKYRTLILKSSCK